MMGMGGIGMTIGGEGGSRWKGETCNSSKPCHVPEEMEARMEKDGSDGEEGVGE